MQVGSLLEEANIQLKSVRSEMRELTANNTEMKAELVANKECDKLVDAVKRNVVLEMEVKNLRMEDKTKKRLDGYYTRLFRFNDELYPYLCRISPPITSSGPSGAV